MRKKNVKLCVVLCLLMVSTGLLSAWQKLPETYSLGNSSLRLQWSRQSQGLKLTGMQVKKDRKWINMPSPSVEYMVLYSVHKPDTTPQSVKNPDGSKIIFPEPEYKFVKRNWDDVTNVIQLNEAGEAAYFYPTSVEKNVDGSLHFIKETDRYELNATWQMDEHFESDIIIKLVLTAKADGYYSLATPSLFTADEAQLSWGVIPGFFQGSRIEKDFVKAFVYGQGIPDRPVLVRERTASTLSPIITLKNGISLAVIPEPGTGRDPWSYDKSTHTDWQLGLSLMNRKSAITPTAYHPVLGQKGSYLKDGEKVAFSFRYTIMPEDWFVVYKHALQDIYRFKDFLALKETNKSLTQRIFDMHRYLTDDETSKWRTEQYNGNTIGAQAYYGAVVGADRDAMKNSDYGAMWMLANIMNDTLLKQTRLPYARNFKIAQQQTEAGFFQNAVAGQYYLSKSEKFVEEWGDYVEPIAITYYNLMDIGNILLFNPNDALLKKTFRAGADKLLEWQCPDGSWQIAYDKMGKELFTKLEDVRPTFYGMVIAYHILKDEKYLEAASKGANWYIKNAVEKGAFLGVCGDTRFVPDFATGQSAQALLDLYDLTKDDTYLNAAIQTAQFYTTSIYTHPIPTKQQKIVNGNKHEDWEISQVGLSFEHGGNGGSANSLGPILLASHAGLFVRMYTLTNDSIFLDMARAAALGRDAFVDNKTSVASYYWTRMNGGPGGFPHHAWWQVGWITDYLLAEIEMRSNGNVTFPRGFITPKVGPHQTYGFRPGSVYGTEASLILHDDMITTQSPYLDYIAAMNKEEKKIFFVLLNNDDENLDAKVHISIKKIIPGATPTSWKVIDSSSEITNLPAGDNLDISISPYGLKVIEAKYSMN